MREKVHAWLDKLNDWGARLVDAMGLALSPRPTPVPIRVRDERPQARPNTLRFIAASSALALFLQGGVALAAPAKPAAKPPAKPPVAASNTKSGLGSKPASKPPVKKLEKVPILLGKSFSTTDLDRIFVGNQAGLLKIYTADRKVIFLKDANGTDMKGVDGTQWAPLADQHRTAIFSALSIGESELADVGKALITNYKAIPVQRNAICMLGVIGSVKGERLPDPVAAEIRTFLGGLLSSSKDVAVRRQAVLALALCADTDATTVKSVITFMTASHNAWETFTTRQFFEYHKDFIRSLPESTELKQMLQQSGNPYSADILTLFN